MAEVAKLVARFVADTSQFKQGVREVKGEMEGAGAAASGMGGMIRDAFLGAQASTIAFGAYSLRTAMSFDSTMTNIQAVTGRTNAEIEAMGDAVLRVGTNSRYGPGAVAEAMYDVVGGVADATTHMAILNQSVSLATAGQANLGGATSALISTMNAYGGSAQDAARFSDVYTRAVGVGVGTLDEFASAMAPISGIAAGVGVSFEALGNDMAILTTKGYTAAQAGTRLQQAYIALLKPNKDMEEALKAAGLASGSWALANYGLQGSLELINNALGNNQDALTAALGSSEALQAANGLLGDDYDAFFENYMSGLEGATAAAEAVQLDSAGAQFDLLKSKVEGAATALGGIVMPDLNEAFGTANFGVDVLLNPSSILMQPPTQEEMDSALMTSLEGIAPMLVSREMVVPYTIEPGDTPEEIAAKTGATIEEVNRALMADDAYVSVPVRASALSLASAANINVSEFVEMLEGVGVNVPDPIPVTAEQVNLYAAENAIDPNQAYDELQKQALNTALSQPLNIPADIQIMLKEAYGLDFNKANEIAQNAVTGYTARLDVGATINLRLEEGGPAHVGGGMMEFYAADSIIKDQRALMQQQIQQQLDNQPTDADIRVAYAVSAVLAVGEIMTGEDFSTDFQKSVFDAVNDTLNGASPIDIDLSSLINFIPGNPRQLYSAAEELRNLAEGAIFGSGGESVEDAPEVAVNAALSPEAMTNLQADIAAAPPQEVPVNLVASMNSDGEALNPEDMLNRDRAMEVLINAEFSSETVPQAFLDLFTAEEQKVLNVALDAGLVEQFDDVEAAMATIVSMAADPLKLSLSDPELATRFKSQMEAATANRVVSVGISWYILTSPEAANVAQDAAVQSVTGSIGSGSTGVSQATMGGGSYADGGWTGSGSTSELAGVVHRGEYVVPAGGMYLEPTPGGLRARGGGSGGGNVTVIVNGDNYGLDNMRQRIEEAMYERGY